MECACMADSVDDFCDVLFEKTVKARIDHNCGECGRIIPKGEKYYFEKNVFDGDFTEHHTCLDCMSIRDHLVCEFYYGQIWELVHNSIWEYGDNLPWAKIGRLTPVARNRVCEIIEKTWEE